MTLDPSLLFRLLAVMAAVQAVCWLLARGLGRRLERHAMVLGFVLPLALLAPWLGRSRLLMPAATLQRALPGAPEVAASGRHDVLSDVVFQLLPWEIEVRHAFHERRLPLWSDVLEGGSSPWINPQAGALSPLLLAARALPIQHHLLAALALKLLVAFEGAWLLCRRLGASRPSSALGAAGFSLAGGMTPWALFPITAVAAWIPWLTCGAILLVRGGGGGRTPLRIATVALLAGAVLLGGHPETALVGALFAGLCALWLRRRGAGLARGLLHAALAAGLGLGLAAPQLLPFALDLPEAQRAHETLAQELPAFTVVPLQPITWFLPGYGRFALGPAGPHAYGRPFQDRFRGPINWVDADPGYAGLLALAGALIALAARRRRAWPFTAFAALSLLLAARFVPLALALHAVPWLRTMAWARFLVVGSLASAVAGALGLDVLLRSRRRAPVWIGLAVAAICSLSVEADALTIGLWALLALAAGIASFGGIHRARPVAVPILALALALDLGPWARAHLPSADPALFYPATGYLEQLRAEAGSGGPWRAVGEDRTLFPSLLPFYGVAEVRPHNPLAPMAYVRTLDAAFGFAPTTGNYFPAFHGVDHPFLDFLNVRVVASNLNFPPPRAMERIDGGRFGLYRLYRNPEALPRWFLPSGIDAVALARTPAWIVAMRDPARVAVAEPGPWSVEERGAVAVRSLRPGRVGLEIPGSGERLLASSVPGPRGWRAVVTGGAGATLRTVTVDGAFLGVRVPAGVSRIELRYAPPGFRAGMIVGALSLLSVLAMFAGFAGFAGFAPGLVRGTRLAVPPARSEEGR